MISNSYSIKKNSKSFFFASLFLNKQNFEDCANLYKFCRYVDDIVDNDYKNKEILIRNIEKKLLSKRKERNLNISYLIKNKKLRVESLLELLEGVKLDLDAPSIKQKQDLINYSYLVAGSVGVMMSSILGCKDKYGYNYAIDLGIAMQLTNIARDILEDAKMGRVYIPSSWINIKCKDITKPTPKNIADLKVATSKLIDLSEKYYESAMHGLGFLPFRARYAILIALKVYRHIGIKILKNDFSNINCRERVNPIEKIFCLIQCTFMFFTCPQIHLKKYTHEITLHKYLKKKYPTTYE